MLAGRHHCAGADNHLILYYGTIIDNGAIAHQNVAAESTAVKNGAVANNHVFADSQWPAAGVEIACMGNVQYGGILNIGAIAYGNAMHVAANYGPGPH